MKSGTMLRIKCKREPNIKRGGAEKMMKQFGRTMLIVMGLAVAAAVWSSIPAQAGPAVVAHALNPNAFLLDTSNSADPVALFVGVFTGNGGQEFFYNINDQNNTLNYSGFGSIPASSINVSGGSLNGGKVTVTLNVNTCEVSGFTSSGPCGAFNFTWVEVPPSVGGSNTFHGISQVNMPGGGRVQTNGDSLSVGATATGTALIYNFDTFQGGGLTEQTNVTVTITHPPQP
jgi:hypothetical protein